MGTVAAPLGGFEPGSSHAHNATDGALCTKLSDFAKRFAHKSGNTAFSWKLMQNSTLCGYFARASHDTNYSNWTVCIGM